MSVLKLLILACLLTASVSAQNIELVGRYITPGSAKGVFVRGEYAYVSCWDSGLVVVNVSLPSEPIFTSRISTRPGQAWDAHLSGGYAYIANDYLGGLEIVDVRDPVHPESVSVYDTPGWAYNLCTDGNYVYMADGHTGYFRILNVSNPEQPELAGWIDTRGWARGICLVDSCIFLANGGSLEIINVKIPSAPEIIGSCNLQWSAMAVAVRGSYAYVAYNNIAPYLLTIDISSLVSPVIVDSCYLPAHCWDVFVDERFAYVAADTAGLILLDLSNPSNPDLVGRYNTPGIAQHVFVDNNLIYVADNTSLMILTYGPTGIPAEINMPISVDLLQNFPNPFNAQTTISYSLPENGPAALSIYNLLGQKVATLIDGIEQAGKHRVVWDAGDVPSGVYFAKMAGGGNDRLLKMILLK